MLDSAGVLIGIGLYFAGMIFIGYIMKNKNKGAEDFLVGGRSFNMFFNTGTLVACLLGGTVVLPCLAFFTATASGMGPYITAASFHLAECSAW